MAYIGREPQIGNYQICDAISVVNGQAAYTMQVSSANVIPESVNHMIVSLNGVIQKPGSSYTISSSTITFSSNLATGDSIDFIYLLGNVLDLGTPSDSTVTSAKLSGNLITPGTLDVNGQELILDADADTSITADTDDQIDIKVAGADDFQITANTLTALSGSTIKADTIAETTGANGVAIDGLTIKDGKLNTNDSVVTANITDANVTSAKIAGDAITAAKIADDAISEEHLDATVITGMTALAAAPADTDEFLISDAGTLKRIDYSYIKGGGAFEKISTTTISSSVASVDFNTLSTDYRDFRIICSDMRTDTHQQFPILKVKRAGQSSFDGGSNEYIYTNTGRNSQAANITEDSTGANGLRFLPANLARDASSNGVPGANMDVLIDCYNVHVTDSKFMIRASSTFIEGTYGRAAVGMTGGYRNALDAIIGIQIAAEGSTEYSSGTVTLYGRKNLMTKKYVDGVLVNLTTEEENFRNQEIEEHNSGALDRSLNILREKRKPLLEATDFYANSDVTMSSEMTTYRQALRDITNGLDTVEKVNAKEFPTKP